MREPDDLGQYSVVLTLLLAMAEPPKCACISDMETERELYIDSEQDISTDDEYDSLPCHSRPPLILKTAEMRRKGSLKAARGRPEATKMYVLG
jgi:hypothetical protein